MAKHTVAMFVQGDNGERIQVGWASPKDESGVRTFEYSPGFENTRPRDVSFEDDELAQKVEAVDAVEVTPAAPQPVDASVDQTQDADRVEDAPDPEQADDPTDASYDEPVELNSGGEIVDASDEDEEAEFQRLLAEEEAAKKNEEQPQTRREFREVTDLVDEDIDEN